MRKTLPTLTLLTALSMGLATSANAQAVAKFTWESGSLLTADIGANATSAGSGVTLVSPGSSSTKGVAPNGNNINIVVPGAEFMLDGLDIQLDFVRKENGASFFMLGGMDIGINTGAIYAKFQLNNGGSPQNISLANFFTVPSDVNWHTYKFDYDYTSGIFRAWLDGVLKYTNTVGAVGQKLYWVGATNATIGSGMDGSGASIAVLDNFIASNSLSVLPVSFTSFDAVNENGAAALNWSAGSNGDFAIERSTDGAGFTTIGTIPAAENTTEFHYKDNNPASVNFYRIKATAADGSVTYSPIVKLSFVATGATIHCYPNPVVNSAMIRLDNTSPETVRLSVLTLDGRLLQSGQLTANPGQELALDLSSAPRGILLVSVAVNNQEQTLKIWKN